MKKVFLGIVFGVIFSIAIYTLFIDSAIKSKIPPEIIESEEKKEYKTFEESLREYNMRSPLGKYYNSENVMNMVFADQFKNNNNLSDYSYRKTIEYKDKLFIFFREKDRYYHQHDERTFHAFNKIYGVAEYELSNHEEEYEIKTLSLNIGEIPTNNIFPNYEIIDIGPDNFAFQLEVNDSGMGEFFTIITIIAKVKQDYLVVFHEIITTYHQKELLFETDKISEIEYEFWIGNTITNGFFDLFLKLKGGDYEGEKLEKVEVDKVIKYSFDGSIYQACKENQVLLSNFGTAIVQ